MDIKGISGLYQSGDLQGAQAAAIECVRDNPEDEQVRSLLMQLYLFTGDRDKAQKQINVLETHVKDNLPSYMTLQLIKQIIAADKQRDAFFESPEEAPYLFPEEADSLEKSMPVLKGSVTEADLEAITSQRSVLPFKCFMGTEEVTGELYEPDDQLAFGCEVFTTKGEYKWLAWENIQNIELHPIEKPMDLIYRPATITRRTDKDEERALHAHIPSLYIGSSSAGAQAALARSTDWVTSEVGSVAGVGQKCLIIGDDLIPMQKISKLARQMSS